MQRFGETPECSPRGSQASGRPASSCLPPAVGSHEEHCLPSRALAVTPRTKARSSPQGSPAGTGLGGAPPALRALGAGALFSGLSPTPTSSQHRQHLSPLHPSHLTPRLCPLDQMPYLFPLAFPEGSSVSHAHGSRQA